MIEAGDEIGLLIVIPTRGNQASLKLVLECVSSSINYLLSSVPNLNCEVIVALNNQENVVPQDLFRFVEEIDFCKSRIINTFPPGKVKAILQACKNRAPDFILTLDDDVRFDNNAIYKALCVLINNTSVELVSFQSKILPYSGNGIINRFIYDTINIRLLRSLYKGIDPFLFGRFVLIRGPDYPVPEDCIVDDIFLSIHYSGRFVILRDYIYTPGTETLKNHMRRVIVLESARRQVRNLDSSKWEANRKKYRREIDWNKFKQESLYYKICYFAYVILRLFTNRVLARIYYHRSVSW